MAGATLPAGHGPGYASAMGLRAHWYFDFISPFAYLQWPRVRALSGRVDVTFRPLLFAGLLGVHGQKGPAEIPAKRAFTYRFVQWRARQLGIPLRFPPAHPFNPLAALRLCVAAGCTPDAVTAIFDHLWREGLRGDDATSLSPVAARLGIADAAGAIADPAVKATLKANFDAALADGVFGVPSIVAGGQLFWGEDATGLFEAFLADPALFAEPEMQRITTLPIAASRQ